jgi:hypothetical protein
MFDTAPLSPYFRVQQSQAQITGSGAVKLCGADTSRVLIAITNTQQQILYVNLAGSTSLTPPMYLIANKATLELWWARHGILCQSELWAVAPPPVNIGPVTITEVQWQPES